MVLARLLVAGDKAQSASQIKKDLEPLLAHRRAGEILSERIDRTLAELESSGLVTLVRGKSKKAVPKVLLTVDGHRQGLNFLGVAQLKPKTTWAAIKKTYLPARVLGMPALERRDVQGPLIRPGLQGRVAHEAVRPTSGWLSHVEGSNRRVGLEVDRV